jgi:steroid delta-isomerase-like uncharacterized protein
VLAKGLAFCDLIPPGYPNRTPGHNPFMTPEENKNLVRRFIDEVIHRRRERALERLTTRDYVLHFPGIPGALGRSRAYDLLKELHAAFPDLRLAVEVILSEDDWVAVMIKITGTHRGPFMGVEPSGKRIHMPGALFYHLREGKIAEDRPVYDQLTLLRQMGLASPVARAAAAAARR